MKDSVELLLSVITLSALAYALISHQNNYVLFKFQLKFKLSLMARAIEGTKVGPMEAQEGYDPMLMVPPELCQVYCQQVVSLPWASNDQGNGCRRSAAAIHSFSTIVISLPQKFRYLCLTLINCSPLTHLAPQLPLN